MTIPIRAEQPVVVFIGPTLSHREARQELDAIFLPPAAQGSIISAVQRFDPRAVLLIDGSFQDQPAVRHKEILWALSLGVPVIGAASMGALRAAELFPHMRGVGLIYRWYRRFPFAPDDAVAVLHGPSEVNDAQVTLALVDLRMTFRAALRQGLISHDLKMRLEAAARRLNFRDRTIARVVEQAGAHIDDLPAESCSNLLKAALIEQKKRDACEALRLVRNGAFAPPEPVIFTPTFAFALDLEQSGLTLGLHNA
jgi:hypothetical protein